MDDDQLEKQLEFWKRGLFAALGSSVTLLATTLFSSQRDISYSSSIWGWYFIWVVIWLAVAPPGFYLLMSKKWRKVILSIRLNTAFGYLGCACLILLSAGIKSSYSGDHACLSLFFFALLTLGVSYWTMRRKKNDPEEIFP
jgi:hypothetical protein